jgi:photosystem II stability/assembly factor-like uncharacterized protein
MGTTWEKISIDDSLYLLSIDLINSTTGWFVAFKEEYSLIYKTTNSGNSWFLQYTSIHASGLSYIHFIDENVGWCVGSGSLGAGYAIKTTNGGATWVGIFIDPPNYYSLESVFFLDSNIGWVIGNKIYKTTNGGNSWVSQFDFNGEIISAIQFVNSDVGWAGGYKWGGNEIFKTTNGGVTWFQQSTINVTWFNFTDLLNGWSISGHNVYNTTNGGNTWIMQNSNTSNNLYQLVFTDQYNGWVVGDNGTIIYTPNGGVPVELISFTVSNNLTEVIINWSTATEINNSGFEILRLTQNDNDGWKKIGFVPGHGTTTETQHYSFTDIDVNQGKYQYKLKQIDYDGTFEYSQIVDVEIPFVSEFSLYQNYPNPFNPITKIKYSVPQSSTVVIKIFDVLGNEIETLVNEEKSIGTYEIIWYGEQLPSGVYFYQLIAGNFIETKKMVLMK